MYLSKRQNGFYYIYYFRDNGKRTAVSTGFKIKTDALKFLSRFKDELEIRKLQSVTPIALKDFCSQFLRYSKTIHSSKTTKAYELALNHLYEFFDEINITELTPSKLSDYFENRIQSSSIYQARKDLICFNSCFNRAVVEGNILLNPCREIKRFRLPQKQPLFFSELEFDLLMSKVKEKDLRDLITFATQTGLRQMELLTLEWTQINFKDRFLILDNREHITKSKKIRTIPLSIRAMQILIERERMKKGNVVFILEGQPINQDFISRKFKSYVRESKINPQLKFHSLRHTFASWLVQKGVSIYHVSKLLGHSDVKTTEVYSHLRSDDLRRSIDLLNN